MAYSPVDPMSLQGEALRRWYLRTPSDIERERQARDDQRYNAFFGPLRSVDRGPGFEGGFSPSVNDPDPGFSRGSKSGGAEIDPGFSWIPDGANRWRGSSGRSQPGWPKAVQMPSLQLNPSDPWTRPVPMPLLWKIEDEHGPHAIPMRQMQPGLGNSAPNPLQRNASFSNESAPHTQAVANRPGRNQQPIDPSRTDAFRHGSDGKLHPIPGWHTTGPADFDKWSHNIDWGGVAKDLGSIAGGAADFLTLGSGAGSLVKELGFDIGPDVVRGLLQGHHAWPKFMGGPTKQELASLYESLHRNFHRKLAGALKEADFPRIGGKGGGTIDWADYFQANPQRREEAMEILKRVTADFDKANGTSVSRHLEKQLGKGAPAPKGPVK